MDGYDRIRGPKVVQTYMGCIIAVRPPSFESSLKKSRALIKACTKTSYGSEIKKSYPTVVIPNPYI